MQRTLFPPDAPSASTEPDDRTPVVAARRRASVLAVVGCTLVIAAAAAVLVGRSAPSVTLVTPGQESADVPRGVAASPTGVAEATCAPWYPGQLRYQVRFDDGSTVTRVAAPTEGVVEVSHDGPTGLAFPGTTLRFTEQSDGTWTCRSVAF